VPLFTSGGLGLKNLVLFTSLDHFGRLSIYIESIRLAECLARTVVTGSAHILLSAGRKRKERNIWCDATMHNALYLRHLNVGFTVDTAVSSCKNSDAWGQHAVTATREDRTLLTVHLSQQSMTFNTASTIVRRDQRRMYLFSLDRPQLLDGAT